MAGSGSGEGTGGGDIRGQILYLLPQSISNMAHRYDMLELLFLVLLIR